MVFWKYLKFPVLPKERTLTRNAYDLIFCLNGRLRRVSYFRQSTYQTEDLFVCLFVVLVPLELFYLYGDVIITGKGLQILIYARHSWPWSSEGSYACYTYCDTGHPFIMVISDDPWHHTFCWVFGSAAVTTCFYDLDLCFDSNTQTSACDVNALTHYATPPIQPDEN